MAGILKKIFGGSEDDDAATAPEARSETLSAEEMRRRRLARFADAAASSTASAPPSPATPSSSSDSMFSSPDEVDPRQERDGDAMDVVEPEKEVVNPEKEAACSISTSPRPAQTTPVSKTVRDAGSQTSAMDVSETTPPQSVKQATPLKGATPLQKWTHATIAEVLGVSLASTHSSFVCLAELREELQGDGEPLMLHPGLLDQVILERMGMETLGASSLDWIMESYERNERLRKRCKVPERMEVVRRLQDVLISYSSLLLQDPTMFGSVYTTDQYIDQIVSFICSYDSKMPAEFLDEFVGRYGESCFDTVFRLIFMKLRGKVVQMNLMDSFSAPLRGLQRLVKFPQLALALTREPCWSRPADELDGRMVETDTYLGPFFSFSCFPEQMDVVTQLYGNTSLRSEVESANSHVRASLQLLHKSLHDILFSFVKASRDEGRSAMLTWVAQAVASNARRAQMQPDRSRTSSDGFMQNLGAVMCIFCEPFLDPDSPKLKLIDSSYFGSGARFSVSDETKLAATENEVAAWVDKRNQNCIDDWMLKQEKLGNIVTRSDAQSEAKPSYGFVTELFFLTMRCLHVGLITSFTRYERFLGRMRRVSEQLDRLNRERPMWENAPFAAQARAALQEAEQEMQMMKSQRLAIIAHLFEEDSTTLASRYFNLVAGWFARFVDPKNRGLPLDPPEMSFMSLPEHCVEDVAQFWIMCGRYYSNVSGLISQNYGCRELLVFITVMVGSPTHIRNPYLRSKLSEVLHMYTDRASSRIDRSVLEADPRVCKFLVPSLMELYIDVELTGSHTQFYDKFNIRHHLSGVLKALWAEFPHSHRQAFIEQSKVPRKWILFVDHLLNDGTFLLDEALLRLEEIHELEIERADTATWNAQPPDLLRERNQHFESIQSHARSYLLLANAVVDTMHYLTKEIVEPFMAPELVDRIALMLDSYLSALAGPRCANLQVTEPDKYNWNPQLLLEQITDLYRHLAHPEFYAAISRDGRYYSPEIFEAAAALLGERQWRSRDTIAQFLEVAKSVASTKQQDELDEDALGDIPFEFLDPITCMLMKDPVILPSKNVLDRSTISRHLLSDPTDPFNRQPLSEEDLVPADDLREKIQAFIKEKLSSRT